MCTHQNSLVESRWSYKQWKSNNHLIVCCLLSFHCHIRSYCSKCISVEICTSVADSFEIFSTYIGFNPPIIDIRTKYLRFQNGSPHVNCSHINKELLSMYQINTDKCSMFQTLKCHLQGSVLIIYECICRYCIGHSDFCGRTI